MGSTTSTAMPPRNSNSFAIFFFLVCSATSTRRAPRPTWSALFFVLVPSLEVASSFLGRDPPQLPNRFVVRELSPSENQFQGGCYPPSEIHPPPLFRAPFPHRTPPPPLLRKPFGNPGGTSMSRFHGHLSVSPYVVLGYVRTPHPYPRAVF